MTEEQKVGRVKKGLGKKEPSGQELKQWLWGVRGNKSAEREQLLLLESALGTALNGKALTVIAVICRIPSGSLISYGNLARWVNKENHLSLEPLNVAWF